MPRLLVRRVVTETAKYVITDDEAAALIDGGDVARQEAMDAITARGDDGCEVHGEEIVWTQVHGTR